MMLEQVIEAKKALEAKGLTVSVAESCTGGTLASMLTAISGASNYFVLGCVTYTEEMKKKLLGVKQETLDLYTVVSKEVAMEMAEGVRKLAGTDIGVATTGYAGPDGDDVGRFYIGISTKDDLNYFAGFYYGEREMIICDVCNLGIFMLEKSLESSGMELRGVVNKVFALINDLRYEGMKRHEHEKEMPHGCCR